MRKPTIPMCIAAFFLGIASPFMAGMFANTMLHAWFHVLPTAVDQWLWPEEDMLMLALATLVFTIQYLLLFAFAAAIPSLVRVARDFVGPPKHRAGLVSRRV